MSQVTRKDAWTEEEDLLLVSLVLQSIRTGKKKEEAWQEAEKQLGRTAKACAFRWNGVLSKKYDASVEQANMQRLAYKEKIAEEGEPAEKEQVTTGIQQTIDIETMEIMDDVKPPELSNPFTKLVQYVENLEKEFNENLKRYEEVTQAHQFSKQKVTALETQLAEVTDFMERLQNESLNKDEYIAQLEEQLESLNEIKELVVQFQSMNNQA